MNLRKLLPIIVCISWVPFFIFACNPAPTPVPNETALPLQVSLPLEQTETQLPTTLTFTPAPETETLTETPVPTEIPIPTDTPVPERVCNTTGPRQVIVTKAERDRVGLIGWPDGTMGVQKAGNKYVFLAANAVQVSRTTGTLDNPIANSVQSNLQIRNPKHDYQYAGGGPVYQDPATGMMLMFYHAEKWPAGTDRDHFYSLVGMAKSTDGGVIWNDLGEILTPQVQFGETAGPVEVEGASYVVVGDYFYVYFADLQSSGMRSNLAVARASVQAVLSAAVQSNTVVRWFKYYKGFFNEPGMGGRSTALEAGNPDTSWFDVKYNKFTGKYVMVVSARNVRTGRLNLFLADSLDGLEWSPRKLVGDEPGEAMYPTIVSLRNADSTAGQQFYVYYTFSVTGDKYRWTDAVLARRLISCSEIPN